MVVDGSKAPLSATSAAERRAPAIQPRSLAGHGHVPKIRQCKPNSTFRRKNEHSNGNAPKHHDKTRRP